MTHQPIHGPVFTSPRHLHLTLALVQTPWPSENHVLYITRTAFAHANNSLSLTYATSRRSSWAIASIRSINLSSPATGFPRTPLATPASFTRTRDPVHFVSTSFSHLLQLSSLSPSLGYPRYPTFPPLLSRSPSSTSSRE